MRPGSRRGTAGSTGAVTACLWPDCSELARSGSELCAAHGAHVDACLIGAMDLAAEAAVTARHGRPDQAHVEHTVRPRPPT